MTSLTAEALSQFWPVEWYYVERPKQSLGDWIKRNKFLVNQAPLSPTVFTLDFQKDESPLGSIAFDCNRFSCAAIESIRGINNAPPQVMANATAWLAIQSYYAAFFAAHSILRIFTKSCSLLKPTETSVINKVIPLFHPSAPSITGGYFSISTDLVSQTLHFKQASGKRPHHLLWHELSLFLTDVIDKLKTGSSRYQQVMIQLQNLQQNLKRSNHPDGNWLSTIREDVNYRTSYNSWFPYTGIKSDYVNSLKRLVTKTSEESINISIDDSRYDDLTRFIATNVYLVTLCCELIKYMEAETNLKTFHEYGPLKLLRLLNA